MTNRTDPVTAAASAALTGAAGAWDASVTAAKAKGAQRRAAMAACRMLIEGGPGFEVGSAAAVQRAIDLARVACRLDASLKARS